MQREEKELPVLLARDLDHSFGQFVLLYEMRLYAFMLRQIGSVQDAEDIVQEAFMQAYFALARFPPQRRMEVALRPWLYKIALNIFYSRLRRSSLSSVALDFSEDGPHLAIEEDREMQPEIILERREMSHELGKLVSQLPEHYRTAINLYYFADLSYQEIADLLNIPMSSVKSYLHRGIRRLRKIMELSQDKGGKTHVIRE